MNFGKIGYRPLLLSLSLAVLVILVCVLGLLQYRWIAEISEIEQKKLQDYLQSSVNAISRDFNLELNRACIALLPTDAEVKELGRERAYERRYAQWKNSAHNSNLFGRVALIWQEDSQLTLRVFNPENGVFAPDDWPAAWSGMKERIEGRLRGPGGLRGPFGVSNSPATLNETALIDVPRFSDSNNDEARGPGRRSGEQDWLLLEVDPTYVANTILPDLLARHLGGNYQSNYKIDVVARANPALAIYNSDSEKLEGRAPADASVTLFDISPPRPGRSHAGPEDRDRRPPPADLRKERAPGPDGPGRGFPVQGDSSRGRWQLSIRFNSGSLQTVVERARQRNLAISASILLLMLGTAAALVRLSRHAQRLAEMEMEFVAGVSHELRTPLTVIRTAAFNLRGKLAGNPSQVERYGTLIQQESEKLTAIVEQVLQFASAKRGRVIREREPISVESVIEDSLQSSREIFEESRCQVEKHVEPGMPAIRGDSMALRHALQNLINNAVKYGIDGNWIGIFARSASGPDGATIEIRVADRGPGIPREEQQHIFDAFFRGKKAVGDQIHGTGLGLNLVKKIVEAHGGTVHVQSEAGEGTSFIVRLPAGPMERADAFTHSLDRG